MELRRSSLHTTKEEHAFNPNSRPISVRLGDAVIISADWGVTPWTVLADGLSALLGTSIGIATFIVSLAVLVLWVPLGEKPGVGTILNVVIIAGTIEIFLPQLGSSPNPLDSIFRIVGGTALIAVGSALYLTCNLGPGSSRRVDDRIAQGNR